MLSLIIAIVSSFSVVTHAVSLQSKYLEMMLATYEMCFNMFGSFKMLKMPIKFGLIDQRKKLLRHHSLCTLRVTSFDARYLACNLRKRF